MLDRSSETDRLVGRLDGQTDRYRVAAAGFNHMLFGLHTVSINGSSNAQLLHIVLVSFI